MEGFILWEHIVEALMRADIKLFVFSVKHDLSIIAGMW